MSTHAANPSILDTPFTLEQSDIDRFRENGHVRINNVCSAQATQQYREVINHAVSERKKVMTLAPLEERDTYGKAFLQLMNLWPDDKGVERFVLAKRFAGVAAQLLGVDKVRVYHDQALYKEPQGGITPWHQDQHYWPLETDKFVTMWMPLMDITSDMGSLNFASGTGNAGYLGDIPISDDSEKTLSKMCEDNNYQIVNYGDMKAGDATFHSGWCLHGATPNTTDLTREVMTVIWFADGTFIIENPDSKNRWNENRWDDMERWLPDRNPGDRADGKLNPLVCPFA